MCTKKQYLLVAKLPQKPNKPYKNFTAYLEHLVKRYRVIYPCFSCEASGYIYDPDDPYDIIEGNKLRNRIKCPKCDGSKQSSAEVIKNSYNDDLNRYKLRLKSWKTETSILIKAYKKLTAEELSTVIRVNRN